MPRHYLFSPLNSISFTQVAPSQTSDTEYIHFGKDLHEHRTRYYDMKNDYLHQVAATDTLVVQFEQNAAGVVTCKVVSEMGIDVATVSGAAGYTTGYALSGNLDAYGAQVYTFQWKINFALLELPMGIYHIKITGSITPGNDVFLSEPFEVQSEQPNTMLIRYYHSRTEFDSVFSLNPNFSFRVPATIEPLQPESEDIVFEDQDKELVKLKSKPYRSYVLQVGIDDGVPDWVMDKLNYIVSCDTVKIAGVYFVREENAKWEMTAMPGSRLVGARLALREADLNTPYTFSKGAIDVFTIEYPMYVSSITLKDGPVQLSFTVNEIADDATELDSIIASLNTTATTLLMTGEFMAVDTQVVYQNGTNEAFTLLAADVFYPNVEIEYDIVSGAGGFFVREGKVGVDWGDDTRQTCAGGVNDIVFSHTYSTTGVKTLRIFFSSAVKGFGSKASQFSANDITNITGELPAQLQSFELQRHQIPSIDSSLFDACHVSLKTLWITLSFFEGFSADLFGNSRTFTQLTNIYLNSNALDTAYVDSFFSQLYMGMAWTGPGTIVINGQAPPAPPSTSTTIIQNMQSNGWSITHDL